MHVATFNGTSTKKPKRPEAKVVAFEDAATIIEALSPDAAYALDPDFDTLGTPSTFQLIPGIICTDGVDLHHEGWLDAA